jgi:hypothetical protein
MTAIATRSSVLAVTVESTEGTPVVPTLASQFIAMQDDADFSSEFEQLENAELKNSLGPAKTITGSENPAASFSHYLRHSGVEGTAPNYRQLLKTAFGSEEVESTEYNTVAASTTSVIKVDVGEGATFSRGQALLIKDGTNGYSIRPVHSIATDDLTIGFNLGTAPGTGVNLGKAVTYSPANSGHQSLSLWHYVGNGGALEAVAGARVSELNIDFEAGQLINASYSLEGIGYYFNPINITATDTKLDFTDDDGTFAATVTAKVYKDPHDLATALTTAMNTANPGETHTVTYSNTTGKFTILCTGTVLSLLWNTGANTANTIGDKIGFLTAADDTGTAATTGYTSDNAVSFAAPVTPTYDSADPLAAKDHSVLIGDSTDNVCFNPSSVSFSLSDTVRPIESICAESGKSGTIINAREVTVTVTALLNQYDADKFRRLRTNADTRFMYAFGTKSGGNWVAGKCGCLYVPTCTVAAFDVSDDDGLASVELELKAYVDSSGNGEVYLSFV